MSTDSTNPSTAPTTEMNGLTLNPSSSSSASPSPASTPAGERVEGSSSSSNGDRSGETTPRGEEGGVTPQAIPQSTTQQQQAAASTVLARDMVHGSPASPQIISPRSASDASSTPAPGATPGASGSTTASPASRLSQARPAPGIGGLAARGGRPGLGGGLSAGGQGGGSKLPPSLQAKIDAMATRSKPGASGPGGADTNSLLASAASRASAGGAIGGGGGGGGVGGMRPGGAPLLGGLAARRAASGAGAGGPSLSGAGGGGLGGRPGAPSLSRPGAPPTLPSTGLGGGPGRRLNRPGLTLASMGGGGGPSGGNKNNSPFGNFSKIVDPSGKLNFDKKAILHAEGVNFSNGQSFEINKDQMELGDVLGKGNYGEVRKVYHKPTKVTMAMKEIRLELDQSKINGIIMELDILHRAIAPEVIEFYGAFMVESCVYYCIEYMDAGSLDALNFNGIPEYELARITKATVKGLKFLKDELQVMHRDVKPTNLLANKKGQIKLCDFGVSGQLEKSLAKTNIGCQSYMAPERIKGESTGQVSTYTVSSDVWSVGLTIIELAMGCYPYPPETYQNVFAQLQAIVHGPPPKLPDQYSATAQDFVASCLLKQPDARPTYAQLLEHPWMKEDDERDVDMAAWVASALAAKAARRSHGAPVSSSAPEVNEGHATGPAVAPPAQTANAQ